MPKFTVDKDELSEVANELIKAAKFKVEDRYKSEQDFLAALARMSNKMSDDKFEELTEEAADWVNDAIQALKDKEVLPALPVDEEAEPEDDEPEDEEVEPEDDDDEDEVEQPVRRKAAAKGKEVEEPVDDTDDDDIDDEDAEDDDGDDDVDDGDDDTDDDADVDDEDDEDEEPEPEPVKTKAKAKPVKEKPVKLDKSGKKRRSPREYADAEKDSYGLVKGTAVSDAVRMFEKGASMKMVKTATGSSQYNILQKLSADGHLVQKHEGVITIKHKDKLDKKEKAKVAEAQEETKERVEAQEAVKRDLKAEKPVKGKAKPVVDDDDDDDDNEAEAPPPVKTTAKGKRARVR